MSYRTFKRVLGETNLERKCRWWFGISLAVMLTLSFYWYGQQTDKLVENNIRALSREYVRTGWQSLHIEKLAKVEGQDQAQPWDFDFYRDVAQSGLELGKGFEWDAILPPPADGQPPEKYRARDDFERNLLVAWAKMPAPTDADAARAADGSLPHIELPHEERQVELDDGRQVYQYFQPLYAVGQTCVQCHKAMGQSQNPQLRDGDLIAVVRVTIDDQKTVNARAYTQALAWTAAIVIGFLSMLLLWAVVRYVIVKPVTHLRDVANAVREGDVEQRATIRTGDEFEELAASFNRMLRQLLSQQSELQHVNNELDNRLDELAQANMRLYEMNRLKSDFLATVSHELRTPLNSIIGFSDVLNSISKPR